MFGIEIDAEVLLMFCRPKWTSSMTPQQLDLNERQAFLTWRRGLAA